MRDRRVPPAKDTKVLVSWNGLMIAALAVAGRALKDPRYLDAAARAAGFILDRMRGEDGRLLHTSKDGQAKLNAYLDDYANLIDGLTRLYEATGEPRWIDAALDLARVMIDEFADAEQGGFYYTGKSHEALIARPKDLFDNATPSGNGMAATALLRLAALTGRDDFARPAGARSRPCKVVLENAPSAAGQSLIALDFELSPGPRDRRDRRAEDAGVPGRPGGHLRRGFLPHAVVAPATPEQAIALAGRMPLLADRPARDDRTDDLHLRELRLPGARGGGRGTGAALKHWPTPGRVTDRRRGPARRIARSAGGDCADPSMPPCLPGPAGAAWPVRLPLSPGVD